MPSSAAPVPHPLTTSKRPHSGAASSSRLPPSRPSRPTVPPVEARPPPCRDRVDRAAGREPTPPPSVLRATSLRASTRSSPASTPPTATSRQTGASAAVVPAPRERPRSRRSRRSPPGRRRPLRSGRRLRRPPDPAAAEPFRRPPTSTATSRSWCPAPAGRRPLVSSALLPRRPRLAPPGPQRSGPQRMQPGRSPVRPAQERLAARPSPARQPLPALWAQRATPFGPRPSRDSTRPRRDSMCPRRDSTRQRPRLAGPRHPPPFSPSPLRTRPPASPLRSLRLRVRCPGPTRPLPPRRRRSTSTTWFAMEAAPPTPRNRCPPTSPACPICSTSGRPPTKRRTPSPGDPCPGGRRAKRRRHVAPRRRATQHVPLRRHGAWERRQRFDQRRAPRHPPPVGDAAPGSSPASWR